jgi:hypothetical protein
MNIEYLNLLKSPQEGTKVERRKLERMNQLGMYYIYTGKCHNEIPWIGDLKNEGHEGKTGPV